MIVPTFRPLLAVMAALAVLALTACSTPESDDGTAPSESSSPSATTPSTSASPSETLELIMPVVGTCRAEEDRGHPMTEQSTVACTAPHKYETAFVGTFDDAEGTGDRDDAALLAQALQTCVRELPSYVGSVDWQATDIWPYAYLPAPDEWRAGARWFRCEIGRYTGQQNYTTLVEHSAPLEHALADGIGSYKRCALELTEDLRFVDCAEPHHREAMSPVYDLSETGAEYPSEETFHLIANEFCSPVLVEYVGASRGDLGWWANWPREDEWETGFRSLVCSVDSETPLTGSVQGLGDGALPVAP